MAGNDANISRDNYSYLVDQLVRETMRAWAESGEPQTKQYYGCRIPDCQCDGSIEIMEWGSVDMTETDDSEYEDPDDRANRLCVEESLNSEPTVQPGTVADEDIPTHGDEGDTYGPNELTGWTGCDADSPSGELSEIIDRPVTELVTARSEIDPDFPSSEHSELVGRPVTTDGLVSLGDTPPPSSDSGIHSLEEQWENMSLSTVDIESEQNGRPTNGSPTVVQR